MAYTIDATDCYLNITDNNVDTFYSYRLSELISYYDDSNFTITDDVRHIQIPIADISTINSGAFTNFADLQTFIRDAQVICDASGGGGGGSGVWGAITGTLSAQTDLQTALDGKVDENAPITGATKTKITYDAKGLVTAGADATTADIPDSTNKRYITDAEQIIIGNTSGTNTGDETASTLGATINGSSAATPNDTDLVATVESSVVKKITWTNVKAFLKTYFDTLYQNLSLSAYTFRANNTNGTANATDQTFKDIAQQTYSGSITWTGTTAPSGATDHSYRWSQVGKLVTLRLTLIYASQGTALTSVTCALPSDCPTPEIPSGSSANSSVLYIGNGTLATGVTADGMSTSINGGISELKINSGGSGYEIKIHRFSASYRTARATIQYYV